MSDENRLEILGELQSELAGVLEPRFRARARTGNWSKGGWSVLRAFLGATTRQVQHLNLLMWARRQQLYDPPIEAYALAGRMIFEIRQAVLLFEKKPEYLYRFAKSWFADATAVLEAYRLFLGDEEAPEIAEMIHDLNKAVEADCADVQSRWPSSKGIANAAEEQEERRRFFELLSMLMHPSPWMILGPMPWIEAGRSVNEPFEQRRAIASVAMMHLVQIRNCFRRLDERFDPRAGQKP
jgi:hypothetical protein